MRVIDSLGRIKFVMSFASVPRAQVYKSAAQTLTNNTFTYLTFDVDYIDTDGIHDTATNNSRLTCITPGDYFFYGQVYFAANATSTRRVLVEKNRTTTHADVGRVAESTGATRINFHGMVTLVAGDYLELDAIQISGGNLDVSQTLPLTYFGMFKVG